MQYFTIQRNVTLGYTAIEFVAMHLHRIEWNRIENRIKYRGKQKRIE